MPKKRFSAEQIVILLRQIEVLISQGKSAPIACRDAGISQQSYSPAVLPSVSVCYMFAKRKP